jgi:hypothetical protein
MIDKAGTSLQKVGYGIDNLMICVRLREKGASLCEKLFHAVG